MRILFINTVPTERNGITGVIFNYLESFPIEKDDKIGYVAINQPDDSFKKRLDKVSADLFVIERKISNPVRYVKQLAKVAKNYDIIHAHGNSATLTLEMLAGKLAGCKLRIAHSHNTSCSAKLIDKIFRPLFYTLCNGRMACGDEAGKWLFKNRNFTVLNNGIDTERFRYNPEWRTRIRTELGITGDEILIGHVGNFDYSKNHDFILETFKVLANTNDKSKLILLGSGAARDKYEGIAKNYGLTDRVIFAGSIPNVNEYLSAIDIIFMPSRFEGLPLTLVEEQAAGLTCVVADTITRQADMTGNVKHLSLKDSFELWINCILANPVSECDRQKKSDNAIKQIRDIGYDIGIEAKKLRKLYLNHIH